MKNVFAGLSFFVVGLFLWMIFSFGQAVSDIAQGDKGGPNIFMKIGFIFMIGGPALFWIIRPLNGLHNNNTLLKILYWGSVSLTSIFVAIILFM